MPGEERRLVTALFCDLAGFTPLSERLDPEEVRDIQSAYFSAMSRRSPATAGSWRSTPEMRCWRCSVCPSRSLQLVLRRLAGQAPILLVLEDLHWIDPASADVLSEILMEVPTLPVLVLALQRPGWIAPWNEWGWPERMNLGPIDQHGTALLARAVLGGARLDPTLDNYVQERAGGNPYVVEELVRSLQETGGVLEEDGQVRLVPGVADQVPATLTEILLARLDRLEAEVRSLAQVASVIGRTFAVPLLAQVAKRDEATLQRPLSSLQRAEVAFPHREQALPGAGPGARRANGRSRHDWAHAVHARHQCVVGGQLVTGARVLRARHDGGA